MLATTVRLSFDIGGHLLSGTDAPPVVWKEAWPGLCAAWQTGTTAALTPPCDCTAASQGTHRKEDYGAGMTGEALRILAVDDEESITDLLGMALRYEGFDVQVAHTGRQALRAVTDRRPHVLILDVMLPDLDGFEIAKRLASRGDKVPILFLTARDATEDKVRGLTLGGDDYLTKPFSLEELVARVRAILRRAGDLEETTHLSFEDLEMNDEAHEVRRGGTRVELTATEYKLLRYLLMNAGRVVSKAQILDHVWNYDFGGDGNVVETYISYLRRKLDGLGPPLIHTVRGVGYSLRAPED
jgi:two-component system, OmpR family, response regulator